MSQAGSPSQDSIPSITAATVKVAFAPDMESLDRALQDAERRADEVLARIKDKGRAAIAQMLDDSLSAIDQIEAKKARAVVQAATVTPTASQESAPHVPAVSDQQLSKLTQIGVQLDNIADDISTIAQNTTPA